MNDLASVLSDPCADQILRNLAISNRKWTEIIGDILEIGQGSSSSDAEAFLIAEAQHLLKMVPPSSSSSSSSSFCSSSLPLSTLGRADIQRGLDFLANHLSVAKPFRKEERKYAIMNWFLDNLLVRGDVQFKDYSANRFIAQMMHDSYNSRVFQPGTQELIELVEATIRDDSFSAHLVMLYVLLMFETENFSVELTTSEKLRSIQKLSISKFLSLSKFADTLNILVKVNSARIILGGPRMVVVDGERQDCSKFEVHGNVVAFATGVHLTPQCCSRPLCYFEVTLRGKRTSVSGVRLGWASKSLTTTTHRAVGSEENCWVLDLVTGKFFHASAEALMTVVETEVNNTGETEGGDDIFGDLFGEPDEYTATDVTLNTFASLSISDQEKAPQQPLQKEKNCFYFVDEHCANWSAVRTVGCLLDCSSGALHFFADGSYRGSSSEPIDFSVVPLQDLTVVVSSNTSTFCDVNLGQSAFKFDNIVLEDLHCRLPVEECVKAADWKLLTTRDISCSFCVSFSLTNRPADHYPLLSIKNISKEASKSLTFEASVRFVSQASASGKPSELILFGCAQSEVINAKSCADQGCVVGLDSDGRLFFETHESNRVKTDANVVQHGQWAHVSVSYTYHRSTNAADLLFYVNGQIALQTEINSSRACKLNKLFAKNVSIGLFEAEHSVFTTLDICNIRVWTSSRSNDRVAALMHRDKLVGSESELLVFLPCNEGGGATLHDVSRGKSDGKVVSLQADFRWEKINDESVQLVESWFQTNTETSQEPSFVEENAVVGLRHALLSNLARFREQLESTENLCAAELCEQPAFRAWVTPTSLNFQLLVSIIKYLCSHTIQGDANLLRDKLVEILGWNLFFFSNCESPAVDRCLRLEEAVKTNIFRCLCCVLADGSQEADKVLIENIQFFLPASESVCRLLMLLVDLELPADVEHIDHTVLRRLAVKYADSTPSVDEFFAMDPLACVAVLRPTTRKSLINSLCKHLSQSNRVLQLVQHEKNYRVLFSRDAMVSTLAQGKSSSTKCKLRHGSLVRRGPHWDFGDEDGGSGSVGVVIQVSSWKNQPGTGATVVWSNGFIDKYRFGFVSNNKGAPSLDEELKIFDVSVCEIDSTDQLGDVVVDASPTHLLSLKYSPTEVDNALLSGESDEAQSGEITKRVVLQYMQSTATNESWKSEKGLNENLNALCQTLSDLEVCQLYKQFSDVFGINSGSIQAQLYFALANNHNNHNNNNDRPSGVVSMQEMSPVALSKVLLRCVEANIALEGAMALLRSLQFVVFGCNENATSSLATDPAVAAFSSTNLTRISCVHPREALEQEFKDSSGRSLKWKWTDACWVVTKDAPKTDAAPAISREPQLIHAKIIARFSFDNVHVPENLQIRSRSRSCDIMLLSEREWHTILADMPLKPNTGNYVWYIKIRNMDKRSHFVFGVSTEDYSAMDCIGEDETGWGLTQGCEYVHDGEKFSLVGEARRLSTGSVLEVSMDTNTGKLRFLELSADNELLAVNWEDFDVDEAAATLKGKTTFPAFSFCSPGDSISLVTDPDEIKALRTKFTKSAAARDSSKNGASSASLVSIYPGAPPAKVIDYAIVNLALITRRLQANLSPSVSEEEEQSLSLSDVDNEVLLLVMHLVSMLGKWTTPPVHRLDDLKACLLKLLDAVPRWIERFSSSEGSLSAVEVLVQLVVVIVSLLSKITSLMIRSDRLVPLNEILADRKNALQSFAQAKKDLLSFMASPLVLSGQRHKSSAVDALRKEIHRESPARSALFALLDASLKPHSAARRARSATAEGLVDSTLETVFLSFAHHAGLISTLFSAYQEIAASQQARESKISPSLSVCWAAAVDVLISAREIDEEREQENEKNTAAEVQRGLLDRALFALKLDSLLGECDSYDNYAHSHASFATASAADVAVASATAALNHHHHDSPKVSNAAQTLTSFLLSSVDVGCVERVCAYNEDATKRRRDGFKLVSLVVDGLSHPLFQDVKAVFLARLSMVMKGLFSNWVRADFSQALSELKRREHCWYYLDGLEGVAKESKKELMGAFGLMMSGLISDLSCAQLTTGHYQLAVLAVLTARLEPRDHELLSRINFFLTLQELLESLLAMAPEDNDVLACKADKILLLAIKVFIFTGMQIASFGQDSNTLVRSITLEFSAHELHKVKSGPATLNFAVFEILFGFLTALQTNGSLVRDGAAIMSDCAGLLLCVSKHPECQKILAKSKWIALVLRLITTRLAGEDDGDATAQRLLLTLSDVLVAVDPQSFEWSFADTPTAPFADASLSAPQNLVASLLHLCGATVLRMRCKISRASGGAASTTASCNFGVVSECVALLRKLHCSPQWSEIVQSVLAYSLAVSESFEKESAALPCTLGALLALGGPLHALYVSCPVAVNTPGGAAIGVIKSFSSASDAVEVAMCKLICPEIRDADTLMLQFGPASTTSVSMDSVEPLLWQSSQSHPGMLSLVVQIIALVKNAMAAKTNTKTTTNSSESENATSETLSQAVLARKLIIVHSLKSILHFLSSRACLDKDVLAELVSSETTSTFLLDVVEEARRIAPAGSVNESAAFEQYLVSLLALHNLQVDPAASVGAADASKTSAVDVAREERGEASSVLVETLVNMGFPRKLCVLALQICGGDPAEALNYILANGSALVDLLNKQEARDAARSGGAATGGGSSTASEKKGEPFHYDPQQSVFHAYFASPSRDAERVGAMFPGESFHAVEEMEIAGQAWLRVPLSQFDNASLQNSYGEEIKSIFVWVPRTNRDSLAVVLSGAEPGCDKSAPLSHPALEPLAVQRMYRVIGSNGALVRSETEISSDEVATLSCGTVVQVVEESVNREATLRLRIANPVQGWISKIPGLLERIPDQQQGGVGTTTALDAVSDIRPELLLLLQLEDNFEVITGTEVFAKEERFFGSAQGVELTFLSNHRARTQSLANRKQRICSAKSYLAMFSSSSTMNREKEKDKLLENLENTVLSLRVLLCRKILIAAMERYLLVRRVFGERVIGENSADLLRSVVGRMSPAMLLRLIRCVAFRGDPLLSTGLEQLALSSLERLAVFDGQHLAVEEELGATLRAVLASAPPAFRDEFFTLTLDMVAKNLRDACDKKLQDFSWLDATYLEDVDSDLLAQPNVHFCVWITLFLLEDIAGQNEQQQLLGGVDVVLRGLHLWALSLKGTSMTLKMLAFNTIAATLKTVRDHAPSRCEAALQALQSVVPVDRLANCAARRLWMEMEDSPAFSRFLQSFVAMLLEIDLLLKALSLSTMNTTKTSDDDAQCVARRSARAIRLDKPSSHIKFLPQKDVPGSWTLEVWLRRGRAAENQHTPYLCKKTALGATATTGGRASSSSSSERKTLSSLLQMLIGKNGSESDTATAATSAAKDVVDDSVCLCVDAEYLLSSSKAWVKIQKGGRVFDDKALPGDTLQETDFVESEALCLCVGQQGQEERVFDCVVPRDRWTHLCLAVDHQQGTTAVYLDGRLADSQPCAPPCPVAVLGSARAGQSFAGDVRDVKLWSYARSQQEIQRGMRALSRSLALSPSQATPPLPELLVHLSCGEGESAGELLVDRKSYVVSCKSVDCALCEEDESEKEKDKERDDKAQAKPHYEGEDSSSVAALLWERQSQAENSLFYRSHSSSGSGHGAVRELTGFVSIPAVGQKPPLSGGLREIVVISFAEVTGVANATNQVDIAGVVHWSERNVKTALRGHLSLSSADQDLAIHFESRGDDVVFGAPEKLCWLSTLSYTGRFAQHALAGPLSLSLRVEAAPRVTEPGGLRVDAARLPAEVLSTERESGPNRGATVTVKENASFGQYLVFYHVYPHKNEEEGDEEDEEDVVEDERNAWRGLVRGQGSVWVEFLVNCNNGEVAFGWATADALVHPDASVDANDGAWTYSTAGQASHGGDLSLAETAEARDVVGVHLDTLAGVVRFYKNDVVVAEFCDVLDHPALNPPPSPSTSSGDYGLRPFVNLVSEPDSVTLLGAKQGYAEIVFPEDDPLGRVALCGFVERGAVRGGAVLRLQGGDWFGEWRGDRRVGLHVRIADVLAERVVASEALLFDESGAASVAVDAQDESQRDAIEQQLKRFTSFRERVLREKRKKSTLFNTLASTLTPAPREPMLSVRIQDSSGAPSTRYSLSLSQPLKTVFAEFALRRHACPSSCFVFSLGDAQLDPERSAADYAALLSRGDENEREDEREEDDKEDEESTLPVVVARARSFVVADGAAEDPVERHFPLSLARYVVTVIYEAGSTVRDGVEIEDCAALRTLRHCETVEAFERAVTSEGVGRFRIPDGWISEKLRSSTNTPVVRVLRERFEPSALLQFKVLREQGVRYRALAALSSADLGMVPLDTVFTVGERRRVFSTEEGAWVSRLRIESPAQFRGGWVSEKPHLVVEVAQPPPSRGSAGSTPSSTPSPDPALAVELKRRAKVRILRQTRRTQERAARRRFRVVRGVAGELRVSSETLFLLKKSRFSENVRFSADFSTIKNSDSGGRALVLGSRGFSHGVHYWEVEVKAASWGSVFLGVAPEEASGWSGFGLINYRATQSFGSESLYGTYFGVGDKIGVLLDMDRGTLAFLKDGEDFNLGRVAVIHMGVAYHNLRRNAARHSSSPLLFPCFGVKSSGDELSVSQSHWVSREGVGAKRSLSRALRALQVVSEWRDALRDARPLSLSPSFLLDVYEEFNEKRRDDEVFVECRAGLAVALRCAERDLRAALGDAFLSAHAGVCVGCVLRTPYGAAALLGVSGARGARVWYSAEQHGKRAWYWLADEFKALVESGAIGVTATAATATERATESVTATVAATETDRKFETHTESEIKTESISLSLEAFESLLCGAAWSATKEHALVLAVNALAAQADKDPARLPLRAVEQFLAAKRVCAAEELPAYLARYAALCLLNKAVALALPLVDLSPAAESEKTLVRTTIGKFDRSGCLGSAQCATARDLLLGVKRSVFTATKLAFWQFAVAETTSPTAAPADEYERPDEIREIAINRIKSRSAIKKKHALSFAEKLKMSVFGQLMESLAAWDERSLRRSYVALQDAGQSRGFFVKFVGEGVDDQGGPYRAVFQTAVEEEVPQLLELLVPCANAVDEIGENRDKFVFNRDVDMAAHGDLFVHLGRLVGVAARHKILLPLSLAPLLWKALAHEPLSPVDLQAVDVSVFNSLQWIAQSERETEKEGEGVVDAEHKHELLLQALLDSAKLCGVTHRLQCLSAHDLIRTATQSHGENNNKNNNCEESDLCVSRVVDLVLYYRLMAQNEMLQLFWKGLSAAVPVELMAIFTPSELETVFCGESELDIDVLKKVTVYESVSPSDSHIEMFWQALAQLDKSELSQFVNFCSGRSRLPSSASEFLMPFRLTAPHSSAEQEPDKYLPIARTCFFSLSIPKYSSVEACLSKLRYAIANTELMDADFIDRVGTSAWDNVN